MRKIVLLLFLFLNIGVVSAHAEATQSKGMVTGDQTFLKDEKGATIGTISKGTEVIIEGYNETLVKLVQPESDLFIDAVAIEIVEETITPENVATIGKVKTNSMYKLYREPSPESSIVFTGAVEYIFQVGKIVNGYYEIQFGGANVYLSVEDAKALFEDTNAFDIIGSDLPIYEWKNGKLVQKGTLAKNTSWKIERDIAKYHIIRIGSKEYYVPLAGTFPSNKKPSVSVPKSAKYPLSLVTEKLTPIFTKDGRALGTLNKGTLVHIKGIDGRQAIINFYGKDARIFFNHLIHTNAIQPKQAFSHPETGYYLQAFAAMYPEFTEFKTIGKSVEGRDIYALKLGKGKKEILMDGSLHAREHMTTNVILEMLDTYSAHYLKNTIYEGYSPRNLLNNVSIWFIPMLNPDGVTLVQSGANGVKNGELSTKINKGSTNFQAWKANVRGVDLNDNFDSNWDKINSNVKSPSPSGYRGPRVFSEPESRALRDFVLSRDFKGYYSYHSSGQIIYWFNFQKDGQATRDITIARNVSSLTGYRVVPPMFVVGSGASTDWFIKQTKMPGLVIEISPYVGNKPVPLANWDSVWKLNRKVGLYLAKEANSR